MLFIREKLRGASMGKIKVQSVNSTNSMQISVGSSDYAVSVTNNRAQYYSEQAKKYRDEAKISRDEAKYYAEQNSNVTFEYIEGVKSSLVEQINTKQIQGDYALSSDIPTKVSELENDSGFVTDLKFEAIAEIAADKNLSNITDAGKNIIRENSYLPPLFQSFWSDHLLNRADMLRADTFSWQDGSTYNLAYSELVNEYDNESSVEETEDSITFKRTPKGYKIADSSQEEAVLNKYNSDGIAWIYILDKTNVRFKLPRMKYKYYADSKTETVPVYGSGKALALAMNQSPAALGYGALLTSAANKVAPIIGRGGATLDIGVAFSGTTLTPTANTAIGVATKAMMNRSNIPNSGLVADLQSIAEELNNFYLYFYVGEFAQSALAQTAGLNAELFNAKADVEDVQALSNTKMNKSSLITYETDWFDIAASGLYSFDLAGTSIANLDFSDLEVKLIGKVKTAQNSYEVGDIIYPQFANYIGNTSGTETGSTIYFRGTTMNIRFGNAPEFVNAGPAGTTKLINKANVQCKIRLKGWSL